MTRFGRIHRDLRRGARRRAVGAVSSRAQADLERQRQRADRPLRRASCGRAACQRAAGGHAAGAARHVSRRAPLPAEGRAAAEARPCPSRPDRLPVGPHDHRRWRRDGRRARPRSSEPSAARLAGLPRRCRRRCLPHEPAVRGLPRRPVFRPASYHRRSSAGPIHSGPTRSTDHAAILLPARRYAATTSAPLLPPSRSHRPPLAAAAMPRRWRRSRSFLWVSVASVLLVVGGVAHAEPVATEQHNVATAADPIAAVVAEASQRFGIPASWIRAVMQVESFGDVRALSPKGAMGLMQIMPETWAALRSRYGLGADPYDAHDNILAGAAYLRELHGSLRFPRLSGCLQCRAGALRRSSRDRSARCLRRRRLTWPPSLR